MQGYIRRKSSRGFVPLSKGDTRRSHGLEGTKAGLNKGSDEEEEQDYDQTYWIQEPVHKRGGKIHAKGFKINNNEYRLVFLRVRSVMLHHISWLLPQAQHLDIKVPLLSRATPDVAPPGSAMKKVETLRLYISLRHMKVRKGCPDQRGVQWGQKPTYRDESSKWRHSET